MKLLLCLPACLVCALGQAPPTGPVVSPRGVINAFTQQPAPTTVAAGGLIWIEGLNLGPVDGLKAPSLPWPTKLGDNGIEVLIDGRAAPIGFMSPGKIVAQVPYETTQGLAQVVVRAGGISSKPARFFVSAPTFPAIRTIGDTGFGDPIGLADGTMTLAVSGLGVTDPKVNTGDAGPSDTPAVPRATIRAYVGGLAANVSATAATDRVGEFDVKVDLPAGAVAGDMISILAGNRAANYVTYKHANAPDLQYLKLPAGVPDLRSIMSADLRGNFVFANGARDDNGCYPGYLFDLAKKTSTLVDPCLTSANRNAVSPGVQANASAAIAALVGPPAADPANGISSTVKILNPALDGPLTVTLPSMSSALTSGGAGDFAAILPGTPPAVVTIDSDTGAIAAQQGGAGGGGAAGAFLNLANLQIDLGDGLKDALSAPATLGNNAIAIVVGDDPDQPKNAKLAILNTQGAVTASRNFPDGWLPLVAPKAAAGPGAGGLPGGFPGGLAGLPGAAARTVFRVTTLYDQTTRMLYILARKSDDSRHGFVIFPAAVDSPATLAVFPDGWFAAACSANIQLFNLQLSRQIAIFGDKTAESAVKNPCPAQGFLVVDLATQTPSAIPLQGAGQMNAANNSGDMNDYIYATNTDPAKRGNADTMFVLDTVTGSSFRFDPPPDVNGFANITQVPVLGILIGLATNRTPGDAGFVIFDLEQAQTRVLPTPDGFSAVQLVGIFDSTRKLVARGARTGNTGSQFLVYDLTTGDLSMPANPDGVAFVGVLPATPGQQGQGGQQTLERANTKANTVEAVGFDSDKKQAGIIVLRIP